MFGPLQAKRYHSDLFNTLDRIAKNPQMAREREEISPPVRIHPFKAHLVIYQIEQNGAIYVIRIRNAFEDWISDLVADLSLDKAMLQDGLAKKL